MQEKRNIFFKECHNIDGNKILTTGTAVDAKANGDITAHNLDPAFGGAIFRENASGSDGTLSIFNRMRLREQLSAIHRLIFHSLSRSFCLCSVVDRINIFLSLQLQ